MNNLAMPGLSDSSCAVIEAIAALPSLVVLSRMTEPTWEGWVAVTGASAIPEVGQSTINNCPTRSASLMRAKTPAAVFAGGRDVLDFVGGVEGGATYVW